MCRLSDVPGNGFAFTVRVRGQVDRVGRLGLLADFRDDLLLGGQQHVGGPKARVYVDAQLLGGQIPHVPYRGPHGIVAPEVPGDSLRLGGGLNDHEFLSHDLPLPSWAGPACDCWASSNGSDFPVGVLGETCCAASWRRTCGEGRRRNNYGAGRRLHAAEALATPNKDDVH